MRTVLPFYLENIGYEKIGIRLGAVGFSEIKTKPGSEELDYFWLKG